MQNLILNYNHHMAMWRRWGNPGYLASAERILREVHSLSETAQAHFYRHTPVAVLSINLLLFDRHD